MRAAAVALGSGIVVLAVSLLVSRAAAGAENVAAGALPAGLADALARREYEATSNTRGLQAPNRAHGLRTYFEPTGVRVHDRTAEGSPELLGLSVTGVGREGTLVLLVPGAVTSRARGSTSAARASSSGTRTRRLASSRASRCRRGPRATGRSWSSSPSAGLPLRRVGMGSSSRPALAGAFATRTSSPPT
jgi:hypothetical protein